MTKTDNIPSHFIDMMPTDIAHLIDSLLTCDCRHFSTTRPDCRHDIRQRDMRDLLIDITDIDLESDAAELLRDALDALMRHDYARDIISTMLLDNSLCPLHAIDYAICFDDDDPECAQIRHIHPSHDT